MQDINLITVSPENGRHFILKTKGPLDLSVVYHKKNLLTRTEIKFSDEYPVLAWVTVDGYRNCIQGLYYGGNIFKPSVTDDFYFSNASYFREQIAQSTHYSTMGDCIKLIKKLGEQNEK